MCRAGSVTQWWGPAGPLCGRGQSERQPAGRLLRPLLRPGPPSGEKPFLCDKCGRGFNRVDNLRSHVKTVHQGKAGMKVLEHGEGDEFNIVTVASDEMVTLATEALAATAVTQLTGEQEILALPFSYLRSLRENSGGALPLKRNACNTHERPEQFAFSSSLALFFLIITLLSLANRGGCKRTGKLNFEIHTNEAFWFSPKVE